MIREREYKEFPLFRVHKIFLDTEFKPSEDMDDDLGGQNLQKEFYMPPTF